MQELPDELIAHIVSFLPLTALPANRLTRDIYRSNMVWQPRLHRRFGTTSATCFREYRWQCSLAKHLRRYQQRLTMGCLGKHEALTKEY